MTGSTLECSEDAVRKGHPTLSGAEHDADHLLFGPIDGVVEQGLLHAQARRRPDRNPVRTAQAGAVHADAGLPVHVPSGGDHHMSDRRLLIEDAREPQRGRVTRGSSGPGVEDRGPDSRGRLE